MKNLRDHLMLSKIDAEITSAELLTGNFLFAGATDTLASNVLYLRRNSIDLLHAMGRHGSCMLVGGQGTQKTVALDMLIAHLLNPELKKTFIPSKIMAKDIIVLHEAGKSSLTLFCIETCEAYSVPMSDNRVLAWLDPAKVSYWFEPLQTKFDLPLQFHKLRTYVPSSFNTDRLDRVTKVVSKTLFMPPLMLNELQAIGADMLSRCGEEIRKRDLTKCFQPNAIQAACEQLGGTLRGCLPASHSLREREHIHQAAALESVNAQRLLFRIGNVKALDADEARLLQLQVSDDFETASFEFVNESVRSQLMNKLGKVSERDRSHMLHRANSTGFFQKLVPIELPLYVHQRLLRRGFTGWMFRCASGGSSPTDWVRSPNVFKPMVESYDELFSYEEMQPNVLHYPHHEEVPMADMVVKDNDGTLHVVQITDAVGSKRQIDLEQAQQFCVRLGLNDLTNVVLHLVPNCHSDSATVNVYPQVKEELGTFKEIVVWRVSDTFSIDASEWEAAPSSFSSLVDKGVVFTVPFLPSEKVERGL